MVPRVKIYPIESLLQLVRHFSKTIEIVPAKRIKFSTLLKTSVAEFDFSEIIGQEHAKRAMEITAAGSHNIFM